MSETEEKKSVLTPEQEEEIKATIASIRSKRGVSKKTKRKTSILDEETEGDAKDEVIVVAEEDRFIPEPNIVVDRDSVTSEATDTTIKSVEAPRVISDTVSDTLSILDDSDIPLTMKGGSAWSSYRDKYGLSEFEMEKLDPSLTDGTVAKASFGFTLDMGDMQFARIDAGVDIPTIADHLPETFDMAWKIAMKEVVSTINKVKKSKIYRRKDDE